MDIPVLPGWCGSRWSGQRRELRDQWRQFGLDLARYSDNVFRLRLLSDAHRPRRTREYFQREPRRPNGTCRRISRPLRLFRSIHAPMKIINSRNPVCNP